MCTVRAGVLFEEWANVIRHARVITPSTRLHTCAVQVCLLSEAFCCYGIRLGLGSMAYCQVGRLVWRPGGLIRQILK